MDSGSRASVQTFPGEIIAVEMAIGTGSTGHSDNTELAGNSNRVFPARGR